MVSRTPGIFLPRARCPAEGSVEAQMEQDQLKWSIMSEPLERITPWTLTEVNQFFWGGLKHVNNPYFPKKNGSTLVYFGLGSAVSDLQTPIGRHHPVLYFQIQVTEKYSTAMC